MASLISKKLYFVTRLRKKPYIYMNIENNLYLKYIYIY